MLLRPAFHLLVAWLLLTGLVGSLRAGAQPAPDWVSAYAEGNSSILKGAAAVDAAGNLYEAGGFRGTAVVGNVALTSRGGVDSYLAKYTSAGQLAWVRVLGAAGEDHAFDVALDAAGNAYVTGSFQGSIALGNNLILNGGAGSGIKAFLIRYSPQGTPEWVQQSAAGSAGLALASSVGLDAFGHVYLTGVYSSIAFGTLALQALPADPNAVGLFLARFSAATGAAQSLVSAVRYPGTNRSTGENPTLAVAPSGDVYLFANFFGTPVLGSTTLTPRGLYDVLVAKFDAQGALQWVQQAGGPGTDTLQEGVVDAAGNLYVAGFFDGTSTFGSTPVASAGNFDGYLAKYTPAGQLAWVQTSRGPGFDAWYGLRLDAGGNPCVAGCFAGRAQVGTFALTGTGTRDVAVAAYTPQGQVRWVQQAGGSGVNVATQLGLDAAGDFYVLGLFNGTCAFGPLALSAPSADHTFVARLGQAPPKVTIQGDSLVCNGGSATLTAVPTAPVAAYRWNTGATTVSITVTQPGTYSVLTTFSAGGPSTASFRVRALVPTVAIAGDTLLCPGSSVLLRAVVGPGPAAYRWSTGATTPSLAVTQPGVYAVQAVFGPGCSATAQLRVRTAAGLAPFTLGADTTLCEGDVLVLRAPSPRAAGDTYRWSDGSTGPSLQVTAAGAYTLRITGCGTQSASRRVAVDACVRIGNVITPNQDGRNDRLEAQNLPPGAWGLTVFNRWGRRVYHTAAYGNEWGDTADAGLYYYLLQQPRTGKTYKGWVEVIR